MIFATPPKMIVVTGGPGAGKTAVLELIRRHVCEHVEILPESASIVFAGGFPRRTSESGRKAAQQAIYNVQVALEKSATEEHVYSACICDRGTLDGLAYWTGSEDEFWKMTGSNRAEQFARYAAVIHLRSPTAEQGYNNKSNPYRIETSAEAVKVDEKLLKVWDGHPNRHIIESCSDFLDKAMAAMRIIESQLPVCCSKLSLTKDLRK